MSGISNRKHFSTTLNVLLLYERLAFNNCQTHYIRNVGGGGMAKC